MKTIAMVLAMAGAALAQAKTVRPQEPPYEKPSLNTKAKAKGSGTKVDVKAGLEMGYDNNILDLNKRNYSQLTSGDNPEEFSIDDPGDFVYSPWVEIKVTGKVLLADPVSAGLELRPYVYASSSIANYEEYTVFVRQPVGGHEAGLEYELEWDVYHRDLDTQGAGGDTWVSAFYDDHDVELYWKHALPKGFQVKPFTGWRMRNYNSTFDYRDRAGFFLGVEGSVELGKGWRTFIAYEWSDLDADAPVGGFEEDSSYRQNEIEIGASVTLLDKKLDLELKWRFQFRDYTTTDAADASHLDREDLRQRVVLEGRYKLGKGWSATLEIEVRDENSDQPFDPPATPDGGDSNRRVIMLGVTVSL